MKFGAIIDQEGLDYYSILEMAKEYERMEFNSVSLYDHLIPTSGTNNAYNECLMTLMGIAHATSSVGIVPLVICNNFRHPVLLAKMMATLDIASRGRLTVGLGAGWFEIEHNRLGFDFPKAISRISKLEETCEILLGLWRRGTFDFRGQYYTINEAYCEPRPFQKPHPPILVGLRTGFRMLRVVARLANIANIGYDMTLSKYKEYLSELQSTCNNLKRDFKDIEKSTNRHIIIKPDKSSIDRAIEKIARNRGIKAQVYSEYVRHGLIGTPSQCIRALEEMSEMGIHQVFLSPPESPDLSSMQLFSNEIIPSFKE